MSLIVGAGALGVLTACTQERVEVQVELDPLTQMVKDCEEGSGQACFELGKHFRDTPGEQSKQRSLSAFEKGCEHDHAASCNAAGLLLFESGPAERLRGLLDKGCQLGDAESCFHLGSALLKGPGQPDPEAALTVYEKACAADHAQACSNASIMLHSGDGVEIDHSRVYPLAEKACSLEKSYCSTLARGYAQGWFGEPDFEKAGDLFLEDCNAGGKVGCFSLSALLLGKKIMPNGRPTIASLSKKACESGIAQGCANYAILLRDGEHGVDKDLEASGKYFDKACALGKEDVCE